MQRLALTIGVLGFVLGGCQPQVHRTPPQQVAPRVRAASNAVLAGALAQLKHPTRYDGGYYTIAYPNGDVPADRGACSDVVVRAVRHAGRDLQRLVHDDLASGAYSRVGRPDTNIDHRRVLNLETFFRRHGRVLTNRVDRTTLAQWLPGDIVSWRLPFGKTHIGVVSDFRRSDGTPYVIHNYGGLKEEDALTSWPIAGHFRYPVPVVRPRVTS